MKFKKAKGFALVEAVLSTMLVGLAFGYAQRHDFEVKSEKEARELALKLTKTISAIDHRILMDGSYKADSSSWDGVWGDTVSTIRDMVVGELTTQTSGCSTGAWKPTYDINEGVALVNCFEFNPEKMPMNFQAKGERTQYIDGQLDEWSLTVYHDDIDLQRKHFRFYNEIVRYAKDYQVVRASGRHNYSLVDLATGEDISVQRCHLIELGCGIKASFKMADANEDINSRDYVRVDGSNSMRKSLTFESDSANAECYKGEIVGGVMTNVLTTCGLEFDTDNVKLNARLNSLNLNSIVITPEHIEEVNSFSSYGVPTPVKLTCKDETEQDMFCGVTAIDEAGSHLAKMYISAISLDEMNFTKSVRQLKDGDPAVELFYADNEGVVAAKQVTIDNRGMAAADKTLSPLKVQLMGVTSSSSKDLLVVTSDGDLDIAGSLETPIITVVNNLNIGGAVKVEGVAVSDDVMFTAQYTEGTGCTTIGEISTNSSGEALNCISGTWRSLVHKVDKDMIYAVTGTSCPSGYKKFSSAAGGRALVGVGNYRSSTGSTETISLNGQTGDYKQMLLPTNLPSHTHEYYDSHATGTGHNDFRKGDRVQKSKYADTLRNTDYCQGCKAEDFAVRDYSYGVTYCIKD